MKSPPLYNDWKQQDRTEDPEKRCLCMTEQDFRRIAAEIWAREALEGESVPAEIE